MLKRFLLYYIFLLFFTGQTECHAQLNDSLLREQLTRGVQLWQQGKPTEAYTALDSVLAQPSNAENGATKVKAAIWTATYLQQQKKNVPAQKFLDSAITWASQYARGEEFRRAYEAYAEWHVAMGNMKSAIAARQQAGLIRDSLIKAGYEATIDSLQFLLAEKEKVATVPVEEPVTQISTARNPLVIGLAALSLLLLILVFRLYTNLQRQRTLPPAPQPITQVHKPETPVEARKEKPRPVLKDEMTNGTQPVATATMPAPSLVTAPVNPKDLTVKLSEVELVLIRPDILGRYGNGEWKSVKNLLNEYLSQLPLILKNLDDAITRSETAPILQGLEYLKPYLSPFGMNSTLALIREVEEDASQVKASKLLSRVFQVRNHTRRAADEAKSILEKFS